MQWEYKVLEFRAKAKGFLAPRADLTNIKAGVGGTRKARLGFGVIHRTGHNMGLPAKTVSRYSSGPGS